MMGHKELHDAVRGVIAESTGEPRPFCVTAKSTEFHPGRVIVKWSIVVTNGRTQPLSVESIYPATALRQLADLLREQHLPGLEPLDTIGDSP